MDFDFGENDPLRIPLRIMIGKDYERGANDCLEILSD